MEQFEEKDRSLERLEASMRTIVERQNEISDMMTSLVEAARTGGPEVQARLRRAETRKAFLDFEQSFEQFSAQFEDLNKAWRLLTDDHS